MPRKKSLSGVRQPIILLRKIPKLRSFNGTESKDPKTPSPERRSTLVPISDAPPCIPTRNLSPEMGQGRNSEARTVLRESNVGLEGFAALGNESGRYKKSNAGVDGFTSLRRSLKFSDKENVEFGIEKCISNDRAENGEMVKKKMGSSNSGNVDKHVKKSGGLKSGQGTMTAYVEIRDKEGNGIQKEKNQIGLKMKRKSRRNHSEENHGTVKGWTEEQELALQETYFAAKPTPLFWKDVSKMVPGKSAQDCFDKIYSEHLTPPPPPPRQREKIINSSSHCPSATELLDPTRPKSRKPRYTKQKSHLVQKSARQLLQKHYQADQDQNADLFSVFEATSGPSTKASQQGIKYSTPKSSQEKTGLIGRCQERSSSAHRKQFSRLHSSTGETVASPPVLKQVKNKALHEKYIGQLRKREAKRNAASAKAAKSSQKEVDGKESNVPKINSVEAAKMALVLDARDAISQFQHAQVNSMSNLSDASADDLYSDEDESDGRI